MTSIWQSRVYRETEIEFVLQYCCRWCGAEHNGRQNGDVSAHSCGYRRASLGTVSLLLTIHMCIHLVYASICYHPFICMV